MIRRLDNIKLGVTRPESDLVQIAEKKLGAPVKYFKIIKKSLDARDKDHIHWLYSLAVSRQPERETEPTPEKIRGNPAVAVVGSGPAGLMCAVRLAEHGFTPVVVERGEAVERRRETCDRFFGSRVLNADSNVQFGEGGAGAFSDGKLNTQTKDGFNRDVLTLFHRFGAPEEILYLNKPHVGSDVLFDVLRNIRRYLVGCGGVFLFDSRAEGLVLRGNKLAGLRIKNVKSGAESLLACDCAVFAVGHSARDTFEMLHRHGVAMEAKDFAVGVRIEHLAREIGRAQYGKFREFLPAADYKLVSHAHERTVFTFCMCPGGTVLPAASEEGGVVVNGMSLYARAGENSNSALMVQMRQGDFGGDDLFAGMRFQREIERRAYESGGRSYRAPVQLYRDFAAGRVSGGFGEVKPTYAAGTEFAPLDAVLPRVTAEALRAAIPDMGKKLKGFDAPDALLTGVETRFSSPVKILRDASGQSVTVENLYPCGEGSGYSGGITSSAADGLRTAEALFQRFNV